MNSKLASRRFSFYVLLVAMIFALAACGSDESSSTDDNNNNPPGSDAGHVDTPSTPEPDVSSSEEDASTEADTPAPEPDTPAPEPDTTPPTGNCIELSPAIGGAGCDPLCQTGCPDAQHCIAGQAQEATEALTTCQPIGTAGQDSACGGETGCLEGHLCGSFEAGQPTSCYQSCRAGGGEPSCPATHNCVPYMTNETRVGVCIMPEDACTFFPNDSCPEGQNCYQGAAGTLCASYSPTAEVGTACTSPTDCNDGQACTSPDANTPSTCTTMCDHNDPQCDAGEDCVGLVGSDGTAFPYGACMTP